MGDIAVVLGMAVPVIFLGWFEIARVRAIKELALAALEAEKQIAIAKALARRPAPAEGTGEGGRQDG